MSLLRWGAGLVALALCLATRIPAPAMEAITAGLAAAALLGGVCWQQVRPASRWPRAAVLVSAIALLAIPPAADAVFEVHAALPALAVVFLLHASFRPALKPKGARGPPRILAKLVVAALLALLVVLPVAAQRLLPARVGAAVEWTGPAGILACGAALTLALVALGCLRAFVGPTAGASAAPPTSPEASP